MITTITIIIIIIDNNHNEIVTVICRGRAGQAPEREVADGACCALTLGGTAHSSHSIFIVTSQGLSIIPFESVWEPMLCRPVLNLSVTECDSATAALEFLHVLLFLVSSPR